MSHLRVKIESCNADVLRQAGKRRRSLLLKLLAGRRKRRNLCAVSASHAIQALGSCQGLGDFKLSFKLQFGLAVAALGPALSALYRSPQALCSIPQHFCWARPKFTETGCSKRNDFAAALRWALQEDLATLVLKAAFLQDDLGSDSLRCSQVVAVTCCGTLDMSLVMTVLPTILPRGRHEVRLARINEGTVACLDAAAG